MADLNLRGVVTDDGALVGLIAGEPMGCPQPYKIHQGEAKTSTFTVYKTDGSVLNLLAASIELQVKPAPGDDDTTLLISKVSPVGITILDQTVGSDTEGQFQVTFYSADTVSIGGGVYFYDVVLVQAPDYPRSYIVGSAPFTIVTVVNGA